jgi:hypothetical protein
MFGVPIMRELFLAIAAILRWAFCYIKEGIAIQGYAIYRYHHFIELNHLL